MPTPFLGDRPGRRSCFWRLFVILLCGCLTAHSASAQAPPSTLADDAADAAPAERSAPSKRTKKSAGSRTGSGWRTPGGATIRKDGLAQPSEVDDRPPRGADPRADEAATGTIPGAIEPLRTVRGGPRRSIAEVSAGDGTLPNQDGQVWREYNIQPYTVRVTTTNRPEQALVDWILRETGYEAWHSEPVALLSANHRVLRAYHTPEMQAIVADVVDRFVNTEAESHSFGLRVVTVDNPNWRAKAQAVLHPVPVQTQGIQAWLLQKEDAALLVAELRKRTDYREHSSPHLLVNNGQSTAVAATRPHTYIRNVLPRAEAWPAFEPELAQFDEGFSLELSPLLSLDGGVIDAVIKCNIDQLEKLVPVMLDVPTAAAPRQRTKVEVPQVTHCRLHERFRWPADQVLLVGLGVVATPVPITPNPILNAIPIPMMNGPSRADLLVFVESKGNIAAQAEDNRAADRENKAVRGRY